MSARAAAVETAKAAVKDAAHGVADAEDDLARAQQRLAAEQAAPRAARDAAPAPADLVRRFSFHPPQGDRAARHGQLRAAGLALAELITDLVPDTPERRHALDKVDEAVMWANAGLARGPEKPHLSVALPPPPPVSRIGVSTTPNGPLTWHSIA